MDDPALTPILLITRVGGALFALGLVGVLAERWLRKRYVAKHGEGSLPARPPYIWETLSRRDRWILGIFIGGSLILGLVLNWLH